MYSIARTHKNDSPSQSICAVKAIWKFYKQKKFACAVQTSWDIDWSKCLIYNIDCIIYIYYNICNSPPHIISLFRKFGYQGWLIRIAFTSAVWCYFEYLLNYSFSSTKFLINEPIFTTLRPLPTPPSPSVPFPPLPSRPLPYFPAQPLPHPPLPPRSIFQYRFTVSETSRFSVNFPMHGAGIGIDMTRLREFNWNVFAIYVWRGFIDFCWYGGIINVHQRWYAGNL